MHHFRKGLLPLLLFWVCGAGTAAGQDDLVFMYSDHEPYIVATPSGLDGFLADYIDAVAADAGITVQWSNVPWARQLPTLRRNTPNVCAITLYKTPEREDFLRFTVPVGSEGRFVLISVKDNATLLGHSSFRDVAADESLQAVLQSETVYGSYIDGLLAGRNFPKIDGSFPRIARSHLVDTAHYFIFAAVRARAFMDKPTFGDRLAIYDHFEDLTAETFHYIGCSLATDGALIDRLNAAINARGLAVAE